MLSPIVDPAANARPGARVLAIGTDVDLARPPAEALGDAYQRQFKYASILADYQMVVRTLGGRPFSRVAGPGFSVHATASRTRLSFPLDAYRRGLGLHRRFRFDLVSTEDPMLCGLAGYLLKRRCGLPLSLQFAGDMLDNPYWLADRPINPLMNALGKWLIRQADTFRVVSSSEQAKLIQLGVPAERIWNIGWLSDFSTYASTDGSQTRARLLSPPFTSLVMFVGRLVKQKDLSTLLRAAAVVRRERPEARFVVVGGGPEEVAVRTLATDLGLGDSVLFTGAVSHEAVPAYYAACDVFALPSRYEGNARVLAEAGAAAKPVVTTEVSGARDTVVDGETGFVIPIGRPDILAEKVLLLLDDPELAAVLGRRAREHILQLYADDRLLAVFHELWSRTAALGSSTRFVER